MTNISGTQTIAQYSYDCFGRRISKTVDEVTTNFYYEGASVIEERVSGAMTKQYIYGSGIDEVLLMINSSDTKFYYHTNSLGSVVALTDEDGDLVESIKYDAYGAPSITQHNGNPPTQNRFMFTGREYDSETGFYYYRARYYDPVTGRFLQRDPNGYHDSMCLYQYCKANPINRRDWSGKQEDGVITDDKPVGQSHNERNLTEALSNSNGKFSDYAAARSAPS